MEGSGAPKLTLLLRLVSLSDKHLGSVNDGPVRPSILSLFPPSSLPFPEFRSSFSHLTWTTTCPSTSNLETSCFRLIHSLISTVSLPKSSYWNIPPFGFLIVLTHNNNNNKTKSSTFYSVSRLETLKSYLYTTYSYIYCPSFLFLYICRTIRRDAFNEMVFPFVYPVITKENLEKRKSTDKWKRNTLVHFSGIGRKR